MAISVKLTKVVYSAVALAMILGTLFAYSIPKTLAAPAYDYQLITQSAYPATLAPGATTNVWIEVKNTGTATWYNSGNVITRLGSGSAYGSASQQRDYSSEFANTDWLSANRPVNILHPEIRPGWHTRLQFNIKAPTTTGVYKAYFTPVADGITWMKDIGIYWQLTVSSDGGDIVPGGVGVSLASNTPAAGAVAQGAVDVEFTKINFSAGSSSYTVSDIKIKRGGVSSDADLANVKLYDGTTQLGSTQALDTNTHKASFTGLSWAIPANTTKTLTVKGSIAAAPSVSNTLNLGINSLADITASTTLAGTFPIMGSDKTIATASVGTLTVDAQTTPAAANLLSGSTDQAIATIRFTAATEAFDVTSVQVTRGGTSVDADLVNIKLKYGATQIGSTVASLASSVATFDLSSSPLNVTVGSKDITVYADVASGITSAKTITFGIDEAADIVARGTSSGGSVTVAGTFPETGQTMTVAQGALTTALDTATNPSAQTYVKGTANNLFTALKFSATSTEGVKITEIKLTLAGTGSATDISNIKLFDGDTQVGATQAISGTTATFTGLAIAVAAGTNKVINVKADIPTGATEANTASLSVANAAHVKGEGLTSGVAIPAANITGTATGLAHTVSANGSLSVSLNSTSTTASTVVSGSTGVVFTKIDLNAGSGENMIVSSVTVRTYKNGAGTGTVAATGDITNIKLWDGATQLGSTVTNPASGVATFNTNLTVTANTAKTLSVTADIPTGTTATSLHIDLPGAGTVSADITSTGASSSTNITETGSATGNLMTVGAGTIVQSMAGTPPAQQVVINSSGLTVGTLYLTAGIAENVKITSIRISQTGTAGLSDSTNIKLYDGTTQIGTTTSTWTTDGGSDGAGAANTGTDSLQITGINNLTVTAGTTKVLTIKVDLPSGATATRTIIVGIAANADVVGSGVSSGATINSTGGAVTGAVQTLAANGALVTSLDAATPSISVNVAGTADVTVTKVKLSATLEDVQVNTIKVTRAAGADAGIANIKIYDGTTQLGSTGYLVSGVNTFNLASGALVVPKDGYKVITVKVSFNTIAGGATSGHLPTFSIAANTDITAQGVASGATITPTGTATGLAQYIYKTKPTISLNSASPSGTLIPGVTEVIRFDITADSAADVVLSNANANNLRFTVNFVGGTDVGVDVGTCAGDTDEITLYDATDGSTLDLTSGFDIGDTDCSGATTSSDFDFSSKSIIVAAGTTKTLYAKANLSELTTAGNSFRLDISNATADFSWGDGSSTDILAATPYLKNLPITGGTLVKP